MASDRFSLRFSREEIQEFREMAGRAGLPVGTWIKSVLAKGLQADALESHLQQEQEQRLHVMKMKKREMALLFEQTLILREIASKEGIHAKKEQAIEAIDKLFEESGLTSED